MSEGGGVYPASGGDRCEADKRYDDSLTHTHHWEFTTDYSHDNYVARGSIQFFWPTTLSQVDDWQEWVSFGASSERLITILYLSTWYFF